MQPKNKTMSQPEPKSATLVELADLVEGRLVGDGEVAVSRVAPVHAANEGDITFVVSSKYKAALANTGASAVIIHSGIDFAGDLPRIETDNPYLAVAKIQTRLAVRKPECRGISDRATLSASAQVGSNVTISAGCVIGENVRIGNGTYLYPGVILYDDVVIGDDCELHAGVVVRERCRLGNRVILQPNAVIGSDGFGYAPDGEKYYKIPQVGIVTIEDDVEIGASSSVDRAAMGQTLIGKGCKIDNQVQIAHNVEVGENTIMVAQTGIAGSAIIGKHCTFGGQSGMVGHVKAGDNITVVARGTITGNVDSNQYLAGFPMMPHKEWLKASSGFAKLPDMRREINRLNKKIEELENRTKEK